MFLKNLSFYQQLYKLLYYFGLFNALYYSFRTGLARLTVTQKNKLMVVKSNIINFIFFVNATYSSNFIGKLQKYMNKQILAEH